jgi:hypothetical protein
MTLYSTYGTGKLKLVDGSLHYDEDTMTEQLDQITHCIAAGTARALLDTTTDQAEGETADPAAVQWQTPSEGWELDAIVTEDQPILMDIAQRFVRDNVQNILTLGSRIAWDVRWSADERWHGDDGMAIYRIGTLLGYTLTGQGIGFDDYWQPQLIDGKLPQHPKDPIVDPLKAWEHPSLDTWIDSTEEPCLLHLRG